MPHPAPLLVALAFALLAGCGGVSLWPFGESTEEVSRKPAGATEYRCDEGKAFYLRSIEGGALWLIAPDREIRLDRKADGRYGAGRVELVLAAEGATLADPPARFANCKRAG
jgi:hypothetical protein